MPGFLKTLYHYAVPRFTSYYFLVLYEGGRRVARIVDDPNQVPHYYQDRVYKITTFLLFGKPYFSRWKPYR